MVESRVRAGELAGDMTHSLSYAPPFGALLLFWLEMLYSHSHRLLPLPLCRTTHSSSLLSP